MAPKPSRTVAAGTNRTAAPVPSAARTATSTRRACWGWVTPMDSRSATLRPGWFRFGPEPRVAVVVLVVVDEEGVHHCRPQRLDHPGWSVGGPVVPAVLLPEPLEHGDLVLGAHGPHEPADFVVERGKVAARGPGGVLEDLDPLRPWVPEGVDQRHHERDVAKHEAKADAARAEAEAREAEQRSRQ